MYISEQYRAEQLSSTIQPAVKWNQPKQTAEMLPSFHIHLLKKNFNNKVTIMM